jgi:HD-GYP domain-containing protein (c-di-GMP phosphodiesterase class II)
MKLLRLCQDQIRLGAPLPWNVRNEPGQLLLRKGYVLSNPAQVTALLERGMYVDREEFASAQHETQDASLPGTTQREQGAEQAAEPERIDPFQLWTDIQRRADQILFTPQDNPNFRDDVEDMADDIQDVIRADAEAGLFELVSAPADSYAVTHSVQTAFVACLASEHFGWSDSERQTITNAALTMNISILEMQNMLAFQVSPMSARQREAIDKHPLAGREMLERAGVNNPDWLRTVEQHHVTPDGSGLPFERGEISQLAFLIHYADVYLAKISARSSRPALASNLAARELYLRADGANNPFAAAIIKEVGLYPPGCWVRLENGDLALVVRRGEHVYSPQVQSFVDRHGKAYAHPLPRDTANAAFKVKQALPRGQIRVKVNQRQLFGYELH